MLIYEVNLRVEEAVAQAFMAWLDGHIGEMLRLDGFEGATWYRIVSEEAGYRAWTVHYHMRDRAALEAYFEHHAETMRRDGLAHFGERFSAERRVLEKRIGYAYH